MGRIATLFTAFLLFYVSNAQAVPRPGAPGGDPVLQEADLERPLFDRLSASAQRVGEAMLDNLATDSLKQAVAAVHDAELEQGERVYLLAQLYYERIDYISCENLFAEAAGLQGLPRAVRARSWLMSYECAWLDGRSQDASQRVAPALRSGDIDKQHAAFLLQRETDYFALMPLLLKNGRPIPEPVSRRIFTNMTWSKPYYGIALLSFRPDRAGRVSDINEVLSYPDGGAGTVVREAISERALSVTRDEVNGLFLLRVVLVPE